MAVLARCGAARLGAVGRGKAVMFRLGLAGSVLERRLGNVKVRRGKASRGRVCRLRSGNTGWAGYGADRRLRIGPIWTGAVRRGAVRMAVLAWSGGARRGKAG